MSDVKYYGLTGVANKIELGESGRNIKNGAIGIEIRDATDTNYAELLIADGTQNNSAINKKQLEAYVQSYGQPSVVKQMNGSEPAGIEGEIAIVTTAFTTHNLKELYRYNGTMWVKLNVTEGMRIVVTDNLIGGTDTYIGDHLYLYDADNNNWIVVGTTVVVNNVIKTSRINLNYDSNSSLILTSIPNNSAIKKISVNVLTAFNGTTESTISFGVLGNLIKYCNNIEFNLGSIGYYVSDVYFIEPASLDVIVSYNRDSATTGSAQIEIEYSII